LRINGETGFLISLGFLPWARSHPRGAWSGV